MRPLAGAELNKLVLEGILAPIQQADWVAIIVPVTRADRQSLGYQN